jgi:hypothetical protein
MDTNVSEDHTASIFRAKHFTLKVEVSTQKNHDLNLHHHNTSNL